MIDTRDMTVTPQRPNTRVRGLLFAGFAVISVLFVGIGGWAAVAPLAGAVLADGTVVVESNRKTIQHLEGGIVSEILVREFDVVVASQPLIHLDATKARANADFIENQLMAELALEARLLAERDGLHKIAFPAELLSRQSEDRIQTLMADQTSAMDERASSLSGQIDILEARVIQFERQIDGLRAQQTALGVEIGMFREELVGQEDLLASGFVAKNRVLETRREIASREGDIGNIVASIARTREAIGETELQMQQLNQQTQESIIEDLRETRDKIADLKEQFIIHQDVLTRSTIVSPIDGIVQKLEVHTVGGVVRSGQALMEIVPENEDLVIHATVSPYDIDNVFAGGIAEVRLPSFPTRDMPLIEGVVETVSPDLIIRAETPAHYLATIRVARTSLPAKVVDRIAPGMPADIVIPTEARTVLGYLADPVSDVLRKSFVEE